MIKQKFSEVKKHQRVSTPYLKPSSTLYAHIQNSDPSKHAFFIVDMPFISLSDGLLGEVLASVRRHFMEDRAVAARAVCNSICWHSLLLPDHKPHFISHWKCFDISGRISTKHLKEKLSKKKKAWHHGRLRQPTWPVCSLKKPSMQERCFLEPINAINMNSWHSKPPWKIGKLLNIFLTMAQFLYLLGTSTNFKHST